MDKETLRYINVIRKNLLLVIIVAILTSGLSYYIETLRSDNYDAEAKIFIGNAINSPNPDLEQITLGQELALTYVELLRSYDLIQSAIEQLELEITPEEAQLNSVRARVIENTMIVVVSVTYDDPQIAADFANVLAENLVSTSPIDLTDEQETQLEIQNIQITALQEQITTMSERSVEILADLNSATEADNFTRVDVLTVEYNTLNEQINTARSTLAQLSDSYIRLTNQSNQLEIFERARPALEPNGLSPVIISVIGFIVGAILCISIIIFFEYINRIIRTESEAESALNLTILGSIRSVNNLRQPEDSVLFGKHAWLPVFDDFYKIYTNFIFAQKYNKENVNYIITSPNVNDGRSFFATNLAIQLAMSDANVLLIDANFRKPILHKVFNFDNNNGLLTILHDLQNARNVFGGPIEVDNLATSFKTYINIHPTIKNLQIITLGKETGLDDRTMIKWYSLKFWITIIQETFKYDYIIWDTPEGLNVVDSQSLAAMLEANAIFVLRANDTRYDDAIALRNSFQQVDVNITGVVLNRK